jgi:hypothetical protein
MIYFSSLPETEGFFITNIFLMRRLYHESADIPVDGQSDLEEVKSASDSVVGESRRQINSRIGERGVSLSGVYDWEMYHRECRKYDPPPIADDWCGVEL